MSDRTICLTLTQHFTEMDVRESFKDVRVRRLALLQPRVYLELEDPNDLEVLEFTFADGIVASLNNSTFQKVPATFVWESLSEGDLPFVKLTSMEAEFIQGVKMEQKSIVPIEQESTMVEIVSDMELSPTKLRQPTPSSSPEVIHEIETEKITEIEEIIEITDQPSMHHKPASTVEIQLKQPTLAKLDTDNFLQEKQDVPSFILPPSEPVVQIEEARGSLPQIPSQISDTIETSIDESIRGHAPAIWEQQQQFQEKSQAVHEQKNNARDMLKKEDTLEQSPVKESQKEVPHQFIQQGAHESKIHVVEPQHVAVSEDKPEIKLPSKAVTKLQLGEGERHEVTEKFSKVMVELKEKTEGLKHEQTDEKRLGEIRECPISNSFVQQHFGIGSLSLLVLVSWLMVMLAF